MRKVLLACIAALGMGTAGAQTLFTFGKYAVSKDEFLRAYNKNKTAVSNREQSIREYLELYSNFKLKVKAAEDLKLDTIPQLHTDLDNFKRQVAENYLNDEKGMRALLQEAFDRSQSDRRVSIISIPVPLEASPADTLQLAKTATEAYQHLKSGKDISTYGAGNLSWKDLGYVTAFSLPYAYENIVYALPVGSFSGPVRTKNSWIIFRVTAQRPAAGKWKIAQILFSYPPEAQASDKARIAALADSVWNLINQGASFADMARQYSNDTLTYLVGGEMPEFGTGKFAPEFEEQVLALKTDGMLSKPFATSFGVHIIRRISQSPVPSDTSDNTFRYELNQKLLQDPRNTVARERFAQQIRPSLGFKKTNLVSDADLFRYADSVLLHPEDAYIDKLPFSKKNVITFSKQQLSAGDWLKFAAGYRSGNPQYKGETGRELWNKFVDISTLDYYRNHLEQFSPDYRFQVQEFRDGNLLFEIMEREVWSKASEDSVALKNHYEANKSQYTWAASANILIVNCASEDAAKRAMDALRQNPDAWRALADARAHEIQIDSGRYELTQVVGEKDPRFPGKNSFSPMVRNNDGTAGFYLYLQEYPAGEQRNFSDARGLVINDYQLVLEKKWLDQLRKKYPVKVNETVLKSMF